MFEIQTDGVLQFGNILYTDDVHVFMHLVIYSVPYIYVSGYLSIYLCIWLFI